jgi:hypothetical protein
VAKPPENPDHYDGYRGVTCIEAIRNALTEDEFRGFLWGNVLKYMWRWPKKAGKIDLKKAKWLIERLIELQEEKEPIDSPPKKPQGSKPSRPRRT